MEISHVNPMQFNYDGKKQKTGKVAPSVLATIGGVTLGSVAQSGINAVSKMPNKHIMGKISGICMENADSFEKVTNAVQQTLKDKGVLEKGVRILNASTEAGAAEVEKVVAEELAKNKLLSKVPKTGRDIAGTVLSSLFEGGGNAAYLPKTKTIVLSGDKLGLTAFHETGHALNANASKIGRALQACRGASILSLPIALVAVLKRPKMEGEQPKGAVDKATTFIKKNAGKLTFATFLPMLIEEGMASVKGCKIAKTVSPEIFKATCKVNGLAYLTYLGLAVAASVGVAVARNIRDKIAINSMKKKQQKAQEKLVKLQQQEMMKRNQYKIPVYYGMN